MNYPKRLIEVDLPIARISAHARREKSIRHGHISTLHIWWARRPLAACRAVILASLWPDPEDLESWLEEAKAGGQTGPMGPEIRAPRGEAIKTGEGVVIRPERFLTEARRRMVAWARDDYGKAGPESYANFMKIAKDPTLLDNPMELRTALLDFIADFANWDNSSDTAYLETSRALVHAAHEALGGELDSRPMVIDPFAGGGSIPLEALRIGADAFASDLNPIPVLLNKVLLEYMPQFSDRLASETRAWGEKLACIAEKQLAEYFGTQRDEHPVAFLWSRTVLTRQPFTGVAGKPLPPIEVPLLRSLWLAKRQHRLVALRWKRDADGRVRFEEHTATQEDGREIRVIRPLLEVFRPLSINEVEQGTVRNGSATCPITGETIPVTEVRSQLSTRNGGAADARLIAVVATTPNTVGRAYRIADEFDVLNAQKAQATFKKITQDPELSQLVPSEEFSGLEPRRIPIPQYGITGYRAIFAPRQHVAMTGLCAALNQVSREFSAKFDQRFAKALHSVLALAVSRHADMNASLSTWHNGRELVTHVFGRQALPMVWDFAEANPLGDSGGSFRSGLDWVCRVLDNFVEDSGQVQQASATRQILPDDSADLLFTDPPYYYSVPYADLADFFYVWLRRMLIDVHPELFDEPTTPKDDECVQNLPHKSVASIQKSRSFYEESMRTALRNSRLAVRPGGTGVVVFADTKTEAWESLIAALVGAGWQVLASWPLDTELATRVIARRQSTLASSVHICCRPREKPDGSLTEGDVGEWREVLSELPMRLKEWMPRLAQEGVVGADAIFACLGPALEIFSRYSRVEKASGEAVTLREYLEHVWGAVSNEALSMIFEDADAAGLEPDARLTAMWLWTVGGGKAQGGEVSEDDDEESNGSKKGPKQAGFALEYDAARKIAQGLGIHLEKNASIVEVKGGSARLLPVSERIRHLFGKDAGDPGAARGRKKKKAKQPSLFEELEAIEAEIEGGNGRVGAVDAARAGSTALDRVHQAMILFASNRGEALRRFLVDDGAGKDARFWKLAQSLSALYPPGTDEKRWVDGVLARKKGLGL